MAEQQLAGPCQPSFRCFLLVVLLALLIFLALGCFYHTMLNVDLDDWPFLLFSYVLVVTVTLLLIHLLAVSRACSGG